MVASSVQLQTSHLSLRARRHQAGRRSAARTTTDSPPAAAAASTLASTDDRRAVAPETSAMTIHLLHPSPPVRRRRFEASPDPSAYAQSLYDYAAPTLTASSLRAWMVQRLMLDHRLDHARAEALAIAVIESPRAA
jgi:hypothetical protein